MTVGEATGMETRFSLNAQPLTSRRDFLFWADNKRVYPFQATEENVERIASFIRSFPLSTSWGMSNEEILQFILSPHNVFLESDNALISFENVSPGLMAQVGFTFWDRKVAGNESFLKEVFQNIMKMFHLRRLTCYVPEKNRVMWRMLERIGFKCEGCIREAMILPNGLYTNILIYGALAHELTQLRIESPVEEIKKNDN